MVFLDCGKYQGDTSQYIHLQLFKASRGIQAVELIELIESAVVGWTHVHTPSAPRVTPEELYLTQNEKNAQGCNLSTLIQMSGERGRGI